MRGNGGGALDEAISFTGLFVPRAPVAQQRGLDGKITVSSTPEGVPAWDGPLAVLIDEGSAAATEIFAGAIQDYGKGLVIGDRSVGRTSVQTLISLDRFASKPSVHYGDLKLTVAQVFRVSGATFEQGGVMPDIDIPGVIDPSGSAGRLAFPAVPIKAATFSKRGEVAGLLPILSQRHEARTAADAPYQAMLRARVQAFEAGESAGVDIRGVQMREALRVVSDEVELLRTRPVAGR
jgi:carboxyl-terminal processing protease